MREIPTAVVGLTEGNGHPFSFASIINGFDEAGLAESGWPGIHEYVRRRDPSEFGVRGLRVTHAWTQDRATTEKLCAAARIPGAVSDFRDLVGRVEAVLLTRDDHANHWEMAQPFLEGGSTVFVDKPLSLSPEDLRRFLPYLEAGRLLSASGLRFAKELDEPRANLESYGRLRLVRGSVLNDWPRYGVHLVDGILGVLASRPVAVTAHRAEHASLAVEMDDGVLVLLDALGETPKTFRIDFFGTRRITTHEVEDNFSMFRRLLFRFAEMAETGKPPIPPQRTLDVMRVLVAGERARREGGRILVDDLGI